MTSRLSRASTSGCREHSEVPDVLGEDPPSLLCGPVEDPGVRHRPQAGVGYPSFIFSAVSPLQTLKVEPRTEVFEHAISTRDRPRWGVTGPARSSGREPGGHAAAPRGVLILDAHPWLTVPRMNSGRGAQCRWPVGGRVLVTSAAAGSCESSTPTPSTDRGRTPTSAAVVPAGRAMASRNNSISPSLSSGPV